MTGTHPKRPCRLSRYIETRYHTLQPEHLPVLARMAERVEPVHLGDGNVPEGLSDWLERMIGEMEVHLNRKD